MKTMKPLGPRTHQPLPRPWERHYQWFPCSDIFVRLEKVDIGTTLVTIAASFPRNMLLSGRVGELQAFGDLAKESLELHLA